uniref:Uncharacterized protein n=1 Tax=Anguilla anguilla TaxID=7936 RepID=A0A0E9SVN8_ANGAN
MRLNMYNLRVAVESKQHGLKLLARCLNVDLTWSRLRLRS